MDFLVAAILLSYLALWLFVFYVQLFQPERHARLKAWQAGNRRTLKSVFAKVVRSARFGRKGKVSDD